MPLVLLGFMGSGKSTLARAMAPHVDHVLDMDQLLESRFGQSIQAYFSQYGEEAFREQESLLLEEVLKLPGKVLISTGGGVVMNPRNRQLLETNRASNVFLDSPFDALYERISQDKENQRPLFLSQSKASLEELYQQRYPLYQSLADQVFDTNQLSPEEIVRKLI